MKKKLSKFDPFEIKNGTSSYNLTNHLSSGDLTEVYQGTGIVQTHEHTSKLLNFLSTKSATTEIILKITRNSDNNDLVENEATMLKYIYQQKHIAELPAIEHIPKLLDSFKIIKHTYNDGKSLSAYTKPKQVNVFENRENYFTFADVIEKYPNGIDPRDAAWMFNRLLAALLITSQSGVVHAGVVPTNFLIHPETHNGILIDWSYAIKTGSLPKARIPQYLSYYPDEVGNKKALYSTTDLYMAAMCLLELLGGDSNTQSIPSSVPVEIQGLIRSCLLSNFKRSNNVFDVYEDFQEILKTLYGKRTFRKFKMEKIK